MATFLATQKQFAQQHFEVIEIDLPVIEGTCTIGANPGFGTPKSCDQSSNAIRTYKFTNIYAPIPLPESGIERCVMSIQESPTQLRPGEGLAIRGGGTIKFRDFPGDPNKDAPGVTDDVISQGTFWGKLKKRQVFANKPMRIKQYRVEADGNIDLVNGARTLNYICESLKSDSKGMWTLKFKDALAAINFDEAQFPETLGIALDEDLSQSASTFNAPDSFGFVADDIFLIGDDFLKITGVTPIGGSRVRVDLQTRGTDILGTVSGNFLTSTVNAAHEIGDEIFMCDESDNERIDDFLKRVLISAGIDASLILDADWLAEIDEWHTTSRINTLWYKSENANDVIKQVLNAFLLDMWHDPVSNTIRLSAVSVWKTSTSTLTEGIEIDFQTLKTTERDQLRASRALILYDKKFLSESDDTENYRKVRIFKDETLEEPELFGKPKTHRFENSRIIDDNAASLLTQRRVARFGLPPQERSWATQEKFLDFDTGDVVDVLADDIQDFAGAPAVDRMQITSIQTKYARSGREYFGKGLTYEPAFAEGTAITITGDVSNVNLFFNYAGAPSQVVSIVFVFDGSKISSSGPSIPAITAGPFAAGSLIAIVLLNGADWQASGGNGGRGQSIFFDQLSNKWIAGLSCLPGQDGGVCYDSSGIDTNIFLSGTAPNSEIASGTLKAPGGGGGGSNSPNVGTNAAIGFGGNGGGGGAGIVAGIGGSAGESDGGGVKEGLVGVPGASGDTNGNGGIGGSSQGDDGGDGGDWGLPGIDSSCAAGDEGKGITGLGAIVIYDPDGGNFINGGGVTASFGNFSDDFGDDYFN